MMNLPGSRSRTYFYNYLFTFVLISCCLINLIKSDCSECNQNAFCNKNDQDNQECCKCNEGFIGNGVNCFEKDDSIIIRGKINGHINNINIEDQDVHAYVHTLSSDARNYVAIGRIPKEIGTKITLVLPFSTPMHWLFAGDITQKTLNGFALTGGVFTRQSDSTYFNEQGDVIGSLYIQQNFTGLYENSKELRLDSVIEGKLPDISDDEQVIYPDYNEDYVYKSNIENPSSRKLVESSGSINYRLTSIRNPSSFKKYRIEHNERIHFTVCPNSIEQELNKATPSTKLLTKRLFVSYTDSEGQVRFSSANFLKPLDSPERNPCEVNDCNVFAECVVDPETENGYYCQCKPGFDGDGRECNDINECEEGSTYCSPVAECHNLLGHYECKCTPPRVGDGRTCEWDQNTNAYELCSRCDVNARCISDSSGNTGVCECNSGYVGNGFECRLEYNDPNDQPYYPQQPQTQPTTTTTTTTTTTPFTTVSTSTRQRLEHGEVCSECDLSATCELQHETGGECCTCLDGFVGNGKYCFKESTPVLVTGKVSGVLNNERLDDLDLYAYVLTHSKDPRNFVAIGKIPPHLGGSFQTLISVVNPINWLFAGRNGIDNDIKVPNGFELTGGLFSRTVQLNFFDESSRYFSTVRIKQDFQGFDAKTNDVVVITEINGNIPTIDPDAQVVFRDHKTEYTKNARGSIKSQGEITYDVTSTQNSQSFTSYKIEYIDEIVYNECPHLSEQTTNTIRVNSKRVFVRYIKGDNLIRFASANFIYPSGVSSDPCELNSCSIYAECVVDVDSPNNYTCLCKVGFEGDGFNCYDVNECDTGDAECDTNAICYNLVGDYECRCKSPYKGNGKECHYDLTCSTCDLNAKCIINDNQQVRCVCNPGWEGDGFSCRQSSAASHCLCGEHAECVANYLTKRYDCKCKPGFIGDGFKCTPLPCNEYSNCNENARCEPTSKDSYECRCNIGFQGDGYKCSTQTCDVLNNCGENARCLPDSLTLQYRCQCLPGYAGNGYHCYKDVQSCDILKNCNQNAECLFDERINRHFCRCKPGYTGDGVQCTAINSCRNKSPYDVCDINADCVFDTKSNDFICKCRSGYEGNGLRSRCYPLGEGPFGLSLIYAQGVSLHKISFKNNEEDNTPPYKNRIVYIPGQTAVGVSYDCHEQYIYWSDVSTKVINRIRPDGTNHSNVINNVRSAEGLAVDWISRNIYFTDSEAKTIEVASLNGLYRKVLIKSHLSNPRGIAVDPVDGYIFWTDWNRKHPKIERANMDGTHRKVIVSDDLGVPNGLYFDQRRQEICWGDAKTKRIECVQKDGSNRRIVTQIAQMYPFDLTEVGPNIYWSDWSRKEIPNVDKDGVLGQPLKLSLGGNGRVYGIVAIKSSCPRGTNACYRTNGDCNQLCLPRPDHTRQCVCSDDANGECTRSIIS